MSRERFNELVEGYALGELPPQEAREFLSIVEKNHSWAREAQETRELVRLARVAPRATAPPGLLHGALQKARSSKTDSTPAPDLTPSVNVILVPGPNGNMRRIPIHAENAPTSVAQADPHPSHSWRQLNWGMIAAALAIVVLGGMVAVEIGPALMGKRPVATPREADVAYLANSTTYESELSASERSRAGVPLGLREESVGFSADFARQRVENFARIDGEEKAAEAARLAEDPGVFGAASGGFGMPADSMNLAMIGPTGDEEPEFVPGDMPNTMFERPASRVTSGQDWTVAREMSAEPAGAPAFEMQTESHLAYGAYSADSRTLLMDDAAGAPQLAAAPLLGDSLRGDDVSSTTTSELQAPMVAKTTVEQRVLTPLEVDFLLAQARIAGGGEAPSMGVGFAPLPQDERFDGGREELAMVFPDRNSYESFLTRVRIMPLVAMAVPDSSPRSSGVAGGFNYDTQRGTSSRGDVYRVQQSNGTLPSPVTGFAPPVAGRESRERPAREPLASSTLPATERDLARGEIAASDDQLPEIGKPLDLSRYNLHLTTDVQTGQVRVTLKPLQPGEKPNGAAPTRTPSPPAGARR